MTNEIAKLIPAEAQTIALTPKGQMVLRSVGEAAGFAQLMASSGMLPKGVSAPFAVVSIIAGASVGLNPFESVQSIAVINGRPSLYGDGMKAVVQGSGAWESEKVEWFKDKAGLRRAVRVTVRRKGVAGDIVGEFSETLARQAGLWGKAGPWTQYPERMLLARARAFAYRDGFADVLKGVRSAEEENDIILAEQPSQPEKPKRGRRASAAEIIEQGAEVVDVPDSALSPVPTAEAPATAEEPAPAPEALPPEENDGDDDDFLK